MFEDLHTWRNEPSLVVDGQDFSSGQRYTRGKDFMKKVSAVESFAFGSITRGFFEITFSYEIQFSVVFSSIYLSNTSP